MDLLKTLCSYNLLTRPKNLINNNETNNSTKTSLTKLTTKDLLSSAVYLTTAESPVEPVASKESIKKSTTFKYNDTFISNSNFLSVLRTSISKLRTKHEIPFNSMVKSLELTPATCEKQLYCVFQTMFEDNIFNWGRMVTVFAFASHATDYCLKNELQSCVPMIVEATTDFILQYVDKIEELGGLNKFCEQYEDESSRLERIVFKGLATSALALGALAVTRYVAVR